MTMRATILATSMILAAAGAAGADDLASRAPTGEEQRMMALVLKAEGFAPCTTVALADGRWSCRTTNAQGQGYRISLSNLDFAVIGRQRIE